MKRQVGDAPLGVRGKQGLLVVGLDFEEIEDLFLAEGRSGLVGVLPIGDGQGGSGSFGAKDFPMVGDADRDLGLGAGSVDLDEGSRRVHLGAFNENGGGGFGFLDLFRLWCDEVVVIADEHFKGVKTARLQVFDGLGEGVEKFQFRSVQKQNSQDDRDGHSLST